MPDSNSRLVYSTDGGRKIVPPARATRSPNEAPANPIPDDGVVRVHRAKSQRGGKTMTGISGLPGAESDLDLVLKSLKASLGTGGTRDGRALLIQGDLRERVMAELTKLGHRPKLAGG